MGLSLYRSQTLGNTVTRQHLYDLISTCSLSGSASGVSLQHSVQITAVSEAPAVPATGDTWWYDLSEELLKVPLNVVGASPCSLWLSVGPDAWQIPVLNSNAYTLPKGYACSFKSGGGFYEVEPLAGYTPDDNSPRAHLRALRHSANHRGYIGAIQHDTGPGEFGALTWYGFCHARATGFGDALGIPTANAKYNYPAFITVSTNVTGTAFAVNRASPAEFVNVLGGLISHPTSTTGTLPATVCPCLLDGPWNTGTFLGTSATDVSTYASSI